jgi:hypothetical protein
VREVRKDSLTSPDAVTLQVFDENGRLTAQLTGDPPETLTLIGDDEFSARARPDMSFTFVVRQGRATQVTFVGPDGTYKGPRISDRCACLPDLRREMNRTPWELSSSVQVRYLELLTGE